MMPHLGLFHGKSSIKVQYNAGHGGSFNYHYDSSGDTRRLTMLLYLNEDWEEAAGGTIEVKQLMVNIIRLSVAFLLCFNFRN
jgi:Rps23 Pro-64 3,4-dihydroxylase Tpa1-like proline 4-hydroxylase